MNANKIVSGAGGGSAAGLALVHFAGHFGLTLTPEDGGWLALAVAAAGAFLVHNGVHGVIRMLWRGLAPLKRPKAAAKG